MSEPTLTSEFKAFKDGVYDAIIHGNTARLWQGTQQVRHYYKRGYDFGLTILSDMNEEDEDERLYWSRLNSLREFCHKEDYDIYNWEIKNIEGEEE